MKKIIVIAGVALLVVGGTFGGIIVGKGMAKPEAVAPEDHTAENEVVADAKGEGGHGEAAPEAAAAEGGHGEAAPAEGGASGDDKSASAKPSRKDLIFSFGKDFVVNLLDPRGNVYLQTQIEIEASDLKARADLDDNIAPLRDATIMLLSSKQRDEVSTPEGKDRLKRELLARYEGIMRPGSIKDIYFTDQTVIRQ